MNCYNKSKKKLNNNIKIIPSKEGKVPLDLIIIIPNQFNQKETITKMISIRVIIIKLINLMIKSN